MPKQCFCLIIQYQILRAQCDNQSISDLSTFHFRGLQVDSMHRNQSSIMMPVRSTKSADKSDSRGEFEHCPYESSRARQKRVNGPRLTDHQNNFPLSRHDRNIVTYLLCSKIRPLEVLAWQLAVPSPMNHRLMIKGLPNHRWPHGLRIRYRVFRLY